MNADPSIQISPPQSSPHGGADGAAESAVPHLRTALKGPLLALEASMLDQQASIEAWFRRLWRETPPPFYASVDLRNSGYKLAPVDTNLFPAGFNNLDRSLLPLSIQAVEHAIERTCPGAVGILLIPESHTRNLFYLESVQTLAEIIAHAGYRVRIGSLIEDQTEEQSIDLPSGRRVTLHPLSRVGDRVEADGFSPCAVLLNNDLSSGEPAILQGLEQSIVPPLDLGWRKRLKSEHFGFYRDVAREFAELVDIDPWLIDPLFRNCGEINFKTRDGEECLIDNVEATLAAVAAKYRDHGIEQEPFVVIKADAGTYGMGIMTAQSGDQVRQMNRKQRNKMAASKGGAPVQKVIIQEGVYSFETLGSEGNEAVAEPVVYMIDRHVVGGFYRVHTQRGVNENLNAPGMHFQPLAFHESCNTPDIHRSPDAEPNRFYAYGVIARLALAAAAREIADLT